MRWSFEGPDGFERRAEQWRRLNAAAADSPILDPDFVGPLLPELARDDDLVLAVGGDPDRPRALLLLARVRLGWTTLQPSQAPLGLCVAEPDLGPASLLPGLLRALPGCPLVLGLQQQDPRLVARPPDGGALATLDYIETGRIAVEGPWDAFWQARGRNLRKNLKRQRNGLEREGVAPRLEVTTDPAGVAEALADYGRLEAASWKASTGTAILPDNAQGRFYRTVLERFCARGAGRIYRYYFGDELVAADLCVEQGGVLVILKTAHDEERKQTSPAMLMHQEVFEQVFVEGRCRAIEFYGRMMYWHTRWTDDVRTLYHVTCYRWPWLRGLHGLVRRVRERRADSAEADAAAAGAPAREPVQSA